MLLPILLINACATFTPVEMHSEQRSRQLVEGKLIGKGDYVKVTTTDGEEYRFVVDEITQEDLVGGNVIIPVDQIDRLEKGKANSVTKAAALTSAFALGYIGIAALAALIGSLLI